MMKKLTNYLRNLSLFTKVVITILGVGAGGIFIPKWFTAADDLSMIAAIVLLIVGVRVLIALWQEPNAEIEE